MTQNIEAVTVFCGSSPGNRAVFQQATEELGAAIARRNWHLVYGGGTTGLMGVLAKTVRSNGGRVTGIIPRALVAREANADISLEQYGETLLVDDMHTRKQTMARMAGAFIALPGGLGTLEELMEISTWNQLGIHDRPIVLFNVDGFYDSIVDFIDVAIANGFLSGNSRRIIEVASSVDEVMEKILAYTPSKGRLSLDWSIASAKSG